MEMMKSGRNMIYSKNGTPLYVQKAGKKPKSNSLELVAGKVEHLTIPPTELKLGLSVVKMIILNIL